jgi:hypothetical protein
MSENALTPATAAELREDAAYFRKRPQGWSYGSDFAAQKFERAAAALDAEAARREAVPTRPFSLWSRLRTLCHDAADAKVEGIDYESFSAKLDELARQADDDIVATGLFVTGQLTPALPRAELRGWGVMRPDGCLMADRPLPEDLARMNADFHNRHQPNEGTFRAVPVRLIAEEAPDAK